MRRREPAVPALLAQARHLVSSCAEQEEVFLPHTLADLHVGAVQRADEQAAVHLELHITGTRGLRASGGDVLAQLSGGDELLSQRDVVVRHEVDPHEVLHVGVVVDDLANAMGQEHAFLGGPIAVEGLATDDRDALHLTRALLWAHGLVLPIAVDNPEEVQQLALVLMHALDLDVEHPRTHVADGGPLDLLLHHGVDVALQYHLACPLGCSPLRFHRWIIRKLLEPLELEGVFDPGIRAKPLGNHLCKLRVAEAEPTPGSDAVGLVLELRWPELVEVSEDTVLAELAMECGDAIDGKTTDQAQVCHPHAWIDVLTVHI
mmetsp:Transcript_50300/g.139674  ORF Transcript_50300/g.139674 Transcript_50300/m.139674 type:complete len:318 (+) Transcript_50300:689-1642(+)